MVTPYTKVTINCVVELTEYYAKQANTLAWERKISFFDKLTKCLTTSTSKLNNQEWEKLDRAIASLVHQLLSETNCLCDLSRYIYQIQKCSQRKLSDLPESIQPILIIERGERHTVVPQGQLPCKGQETIDLTTLSPQAAQIMHSYLENAELFDAPITTETLFELMTFAKEKGFSSLSSLCRVGAGCDLLKASFGFSNDDPEALYSKIQALSLTPMPDGLSDLYYCNIYAELDDANFVSALNTACSSDVLKGLRTKCLEYATHKLNNLLKAQQFVSAILLPYLQYDWLIPFFTQYFKIQCAEAYKYHKSSPLSCFQKVLVMHEKQPEHVGNLLLFVKDTLQMLPYFQKISLIATNRAEIWRLLDIVCAYPSLKVIEIKIQNIPMARPQTPDGDFEDLVTDWKQQNKDKADRDIAITF